MYGRFTEKAERAISFAQESAMKLGHTYVERNMYSGAYKRRHRVAYHVLSSHGLTYDKVMREIEDMIGRGEKVPSSQSALRQEPRGFLK